MKPPRSVAETRISYVKEESAGMGTGMIRALRQLREENKLLKEAVNDLTLENAMLNAIIRTVVLRFSAGAPPQLYGRDGT